MKFTRITDEGEEDDNNSARAVKSIVIFPQRLQIAHHQSYRYPFYLLLIFQSRALVRDRRMISNNNNDSSSSLRESITVR